MVKKLDFNALEKPVLEITLRDKEQTVVRITAPTEELIERFTAAAGELKDLDLANNADARAAMYDLIAELVNCNLDDIKVSGDELRTRYGLQRYDLVVFVKVYLDFVKELESVKN